MDVEPEIWAPGSFTKHFAWGPGSNGLAKLQQIIKKGFDGKVEDTPRDLFRQRVEGAGRQGLLAINFFLYNKIEGGIDYAVADEFVFQAVMTEHSPRFDRLALFLFLFSYVGAWKGASPQQRRPALWANRYVKQRVAGDFGWDVRNVDASDIQRFVQGSPSYRGKTSRKLATNFANLLNQGGLTDFASSRVERWWVDALFATLDRLAEDRIPGGGATPDTRLADLLSRSDFPVIAGRSSLEKVFAAKHLVKLYVACGGRERFSEEQVKARTEIKLPDVAWFVANDPRPRGAVHPTNPAILKSIPPACAMLAHHVAGFDELAPDQMVDFDPEEYVRQRTAFALGRLQDRGAEPTMSVEELMRITRDR